MYLYDDSGEEKKVKLNKKKNYLKYESYESKKLI